MSKKNKARRGTPASQSSGQPGTRPATAPAGQGSVRDGRTEADAIVERVLSSLWTAIASGDPLRAELETATCMAIPYVAGQQDPAEIESFISTVLVDGAVRRRTPDGAALLRLLMVLGTQDTKRAASRALAELTGAGIYPPEWVTEIGKVTPGQAWRRYDVFGDDEAIAVTFGLRRGRTRHRSAGRPGRDPRRHRDRRVLRRGPPDRGHQRQQRGIRPVRADQPGRGAASAAAAAGPGRPRPEPRTCPPTASPTCPIARSRVRRLPAGDSPHPGRCSPRPTARPRSTSS